MTVLRTDSAQKCHRVTSGQAVYVCVYFDFYQGGLFIIGIYLSATILIIIIYV